MYLWEFKIKTREYFFGNFFAQMNLMVAGYFGGGGCRKKNISPHSLFLYLLFYHTINHFYE